MLVPLWLLVIANVYFGVHTEVTRRPGAPGRRGADRRCRMNGMQLLAFIPLVPLLAVLAILATARWPNVREGVSVSGRRAAVRAGGGAGRTGGFAGGADPGAGRAVAGTDPGAVAGAAGHVVRPGGQLPVAGHDGVRHRLHARPPRGQPDPLLCRLCRLDRGDHGHRAVGQYADAVPVLRAADPVDLSAGHPCR